MFPALGRSAGVLRRGAEGLQKVLKRNYEGGVPGANMPFDMENPYKLTGYFCIFLGVPFNLPFLVLRHHYLKESATPEES